MAEAADEVSRAQVDELDPFLIQRSLDLGVLHALHLTPGKGEGR